MSLLKKLGYNRKEEVLEFNNKRSCGLWLLLIGLVLAISLACGGDFYINPFVFMAGYCICFYIANINKKVRQHFSNGKFSKFQIKIVYISLALLFILMFLIAGPFFAGFRWKFIWLGVLLATGIHFFILYYTHGKSMLLIGFLCSINAVLGYILKDVPFVYFGAVDAIIKILFGLYLLFLSKPSTSKKYIK